MGRIITLQLTDAEDAAIAGWVNYYRANPQFVGVPPPPNPTQPPHYQSRIVLDSTQVARYNELNAQFPVNPPADQFADLKWRQKYVGSWAAFAPVFFKESNALKAAYPQLENTVSLLNNYYGPGGYGNVSGSRNGNAFTFFNFITQKDEPDVDGAADAFILTQPGNPNHVPPPAIVIP
jgi:hypothetical protein